MSWWSCGSECGRGALNDDLLTSVASVQRACAVDMRRAQSEFSRDDARGATLEAPASPDRAAPEAEELGGSMAADYDSSPSRQRFGSSNDHDAGTGDLGWLNWLVKQLWPYAEQALEKSIAQDVLPLLDDSLPAVVKPVTLTKFKLGTQTPQLGPIRGYTKRRQEHQGLELDIGLDLDCDAEIALTAGHVPVGIRKIRLSGTLCCVLKPLLNTLPIVGGVQVFFMQPPSFDVDFTGIGNIADMPVISKTIRNVVADVIRAQMVLPNRIYVPIADPVEAKIDLTAMTHPMPEGLLQLQIHGCTNLKAADVTLFGRKTSDPYVVLRCGNAVHKTSVVKKTCNPTWPDFFANMFVHNPHQPVTLEVFDSDFGKADDFLGSLSLSVAELERAGDEATFELDTSKVPHAPAGAAVCVTAQFFRLARGLESFKPRQAEAGPLSSQAVVSVKAKGARGIPPEFTAGTIAKIEVDGQQFKSEGAELQPGGTVAGISAELQSLVTRLYFEERYDRQRIAGLAGMPLLDVEKILCAAKVNTCVWHFGTHVLVPRPNDTTVKVTVRVPQGLGHQPVAGSTTVELERVVADGGTRQIDVQMSVGPYTVQLDAEVIVSGLELAKPLPGSARSGSRLQ